MIDLRLGDCLDIMRGMDADSVDAVVTDPPYGLSFMGKDWDHGVPGIHFWSEALRVAKPGAYLLAFGGTRTYHRLVCAIEDAGFEIRDMIEWVYGSGFPKSLDVSKAIDKAAGAEREVIGQGPFSARRPHADHDKQGLTFADDSYIRPAGHDVTAPATDAAREWSGWGTALKPAHEPIVVARKPLSEATVAANVMQWGTGALNIDVGRVETNWNNESSVRHGHTNKECASEGITGWGANRMHAEPHANGRFPANLITDGSAEVVAMFPQAQSGGIGKSKQRGCFEGGHGGTSGNFYMDTGSAARFFKSCPLDDDDYPPLYYCAKASKAERDAGCGGIPSEVQRYVNNRRCKKCGHQQVSGSPCKCDVPEWEVVETPRVARNGHPTVKPLSLMRYLITLCTREGVTVLDPFMGSGTTGVACVQLGRNFIGCDNVAEYVEIAKRRIEAAQPVAIELPLMVSA